jgi:hypothetical protein
MRVAHALRETAGALLAAPIVALQSIGAPRGTRAVRAGVADTISR